MNECIENGFERKTTNIAENCDPYPFEIIKHLSFNLAFGTCPDMVNGFYQKIDQIVCKGPAPKVDEGGQTGQPVCIGMPAHFVRGFNRNTPAAALQCQLRSVGEKIWWQGN